MRRNTENLVKAPLSFDPQYSSTKWGLVVNAVLSLILSHSAEFRIIY